MLLMGPGHLSHNIISMQVRSDAADAMSAGGHQGYAALGGLHTQSRPLVPHLYGPTEQQYLKAAVSQDFYFEMMDSI